MYCIYLFLILIERWEYLTLDTSSMDKWREGWVTSSALGSCFDDLTILASKFAKVIKKFNMSSIVTQFLEAALLCSIQHRHGNGSSEHLAHFLYSFDLFLVFQMVDWGILVKPSILHFMIYLWHFLSDCMWKRPINIAYLVTFNRFMWRCGWFISDTIHHTEYRFVTVYICCFRCIALHFKVDHFLILCLTSHLILSHLFPSPPLSPLSECPRLNNNDKFCRFSQTGMPTERKIEHGGGRRSEWPPTSEDKKQGDKNMVREKDTQGDGERRVITGLPEFSKQLFYLFLPVAEKTRSGGEEGREIKTTTLWSFSHNKSHWITRPRAHHTQRHARLIHSWVSLLWVFISHGKERQERANNALFILLIYLCVY